jgi:hypothetical protein
MVASKGTIDILTYRPLLLTVKPRLPQMPLPQLPHLLYRGPADATFVACN